MPPKPASAARRWPLGGGSPPPPKAPARQVLEALQAEVTRLQRIIERKDEQIKLLNFRLFGPKSEKLSRAQIPLLLAKISLTAGEVDQEAELPQAQKDAPLPQAKKLRPNHPGRELLALHLERREEFMACCPEDCTCSKCGDQRPGDWLRDARRTGL